MKDNKALTIGFPPIAKSEWTAKIEKDLRGADFRETLVWDTADGFEVAPFYHPEDQEQFAYLGKYSNAFLNKTKPEYSGRAWGNMPEVEVRDLETANKEALTALNNGADGLVFALEAPLSAANLVILLKDVQLPYCYISFRLPAQPQTFLRNLVKFIDDSRTDIHKVQASIISETPVAAEEATEFFSQLSKAGKLKYQIQPTDPNETVSEQVANVLLQTSKLLEAATKTIPAARFFETVEWGCSVGDSFFMEIARFRATRILLHQMAQLSEAGTVAPQEIRLHAFTTLANDSEAEADPYLNLLSNTSQAMAAVMGGCDGLTVLPHDKGYTTNDLFAPRIARNVSNILKEEAFLDKVADPAAGSYYIEALTDKVAQTAWERFQELV